MQIMSENHIRWQEFIFRMAGLLGNSNSNCRSLNPKAVLAEMGFSPEEILASEKYFYTLSEYSGRDAARSQLSEAGFNDNEIKEILLQTDHIESPEQVWDFLEQKLKEKG